jgi:CRP-like cAMP-binding protein
MEPSDLLRKIHLFKCLSSSDLSDLAVRTRTLSVRKGEVLFRKGSEGTTLYMVLEGAIKIVLPSRLGDEMIITIFSEGDFFGEMSLLDEMPRSADAVAVTDSRLLLLNRREFLAFLKSSEAAIQRILSDLSQRIRSTDNLLEDTSFLNIPARFAKKLLELADSFGRREADHIEISLRLTQKDLADMVGATRESINKELRSLREKGIVSISDRAIRIHDTERLRRKIH